MTVFREVVKPMVIASTIPSSDESQPIKLFSSLSPQILSKNRQLFLVKESILLTDHSNWVTQLQFINPASVTPLESELWCVMGMSSGVSWVCFREAEFATRNETLCVSASCMILSYLWDTLVRGSSGCHEIYVALKVFSIPFVEVHNLPSSKPVWPTRCTVLLLLIWRQQ